MIYLNKTILSVAIVLVCFSASAQTSEQDFESPPEHLFERADISKIPSEPPQAMSQGRFKHSGINGNYYLFSPPRVGSGATARPLLVFLHGCTQDPEEFATLTKMNELAIRENFYVLYPQQTESRNGNKCWNWFETENQRDPLTLKGDVSSELGWIANLTEVIASELGADTNRIYVAGLSAGAAMAVNLLSCYPDLYTSGGVFSGVSYGSATNLLEAMTAMRIGGLRSSEATAEKAFACAGQKIGPPVSLMVFHGKFDLVISHRNAKQIVSHFGAYNDLRDDGEANDSSVLKLTSTKNVRGRKKSNSFVTEDYKTANGGKIRFVSVKKLGHAWSGGAPDSRYSESKSPSATDLLWNFFASLPEKENAETTVDVPNTDPVPDKR